MYSEQVLDLAEIQPDEPRLIRRSEYERMVDLGLFEDERIELLYGVIVKMSPHGPEHDSALSRLTVLLVKALSDGASVRIQSAFAASDGSEPEPDVCVVPLGDYDAAHPATAWLIVEISKSSLLKDRGPKARLYAESGVSEYWVVNLVDGLVEVHTTPRGGLYRTITRYGLDDVVRSERFPALEIPVSAVLKPTPTTG
ncbi:MAG TPA: Uma2 family endonuclease [Polyangiaceae bacterium]